MITLTQRSSNAITPVAATLTPPLPQTNNAALIQGAAAKGDPAQREDGGPTAAPLIGVNVAVEKRGVVDTKEATVTLHTQESVDASTGSATSTDATRLLTTETVEPLDARPHPPADTTSGSSALIAQRPLGAVSSGAATPRGSPLQAGDVSAMLAHDMNAINDTGRSEGLSSAAPSSHTSSSMTPLRSQLNHWLVERKQRLNGTPDMRGR